MTTLTAPEELDVAAPPRERSQLRLRRASRLERTVELTDGKWSIGSSPRCQVRLPAGESQPLQCLLTLSANSAEVTRWAAGVLLNGREFARQTLAAGDLLTIGGWELEWQPATGERRPRPDRKSRVVAEPPQQPLDLPRALERETVDYVVPAVPVNGAAVQPTLKSTSPAVQAPAVLPEPPAVVVIDRPAAPQTEIAATSPPRVAEEPSAVAIVEPAAPARRPAAKTVLVSSRLTDPFDGLLGPAPRTVASPPAVAPTVNAAAAAFQDQLVLGLWQSRFAARDRARQLVASMRAARTRVAELQSAIATIEEQLARETARAAAAAADRLAQSARLENELAAAQADRQQLASELEALRNARPRTAPPDPRLQTLADELTQAQREVSELRTQLGAQELELEAIRTQAEAAEADRRAEAEQFAASQASSVARDEELTAERAAWEQERAAADADANRLREQLYACEMQIEELRGQVTEADAARTAVAEQLETAKKQQSQWLAECQSLQDSQAAEFAEACAQRDGLLTQLEQLAAALSQRDASPAKIPAASAPDLDWNLPANANAEGDRPEEGAAASEPSWASWADEPHRAVAPAESSRATVVEAIPRHAAVPTEPADVDKAARLQESEPATAQEGAEPAPEPPIAPRAAVEQPAPIEPPSEPYEPASFIDKYRHLLEEGGDAEPSPRLSRPTLDDEYQSTRSSAALASPEEDADEALEAYMSNLMRRVRGDGSSAAVAAASAARFLDAPTNLATSVGPDLIESEPAEDPEIELDANGMMRLSRKQPVNTDLSAMRELANTSARTAIARHRQRRLAELALSKGVICVLASGASAFLITTAPSTNSPWFWGGCVTLAAAAVTGVQLAFIGFQRLRDGRSRRRTSQFLQDERGSATAPAPVSDVEASVESA